MVPPLGMDTGHPLPATALPFTDLLHYPLSADSQAPAPLIDHSSGRLSTLIPSQGLGSLAGPGVAFTPPVRGVRAFLPLAPLLLSLHPAPKYSVMIPMPFVQMEK
jgi:hypothetical protein